MLNIAIDGPSGVGKSTIAKAIAKRLGIIYLDTGAMYRAAAYFALKKGADVNDESQVKPLLSELNMEIRYAGGVQTIYVNGEDVTPYLREHHMSKAASDISALPSVRIKLVELQQAIARSADIVLDGRDIGTVVLPNASHKFFVTADAAERAKRRLIELREKGSDITFAEILKDIEKRDYNDSHRAHSPLKKADDAVLIDTTNMTAEQAVEAVLGYIAR
ncbi:MAG TPA: (d)CMP kinase [Eubacteriales bacterium]|nr:(d)CMP kinase [Clostridia bacterium]HRR89907.1 (d)CMP kinase [Eubacteriales bacterium]HRU84105.1 (d)CMP kinase [Eubacteriales bacterium]